MKRAYSYVRFSTAVEVWRGKMRIVRSARRARLLKRRGVPMWDLRERGKRLWLWFVEEAQQC